MNRLYNNRFYLKLPNILTSYLLLIFFTVLANSIEGHAQTATHSYLASASLKPTPILSDLKTTDKSKKEQKYFGVSKLYDLHNHENKLIDVDIRQNWINATVNQLLSELNGCDFPKVEFSEVDIDNFYQVNIRLQEKGKIEFKDGGFMLLVSHSAHSYPVIGDITIGIDANKNIYVNEGHICGGIIHFTSHKKNKTINIHDFIEYFKADTDDQQWKEIKIKNNTKF